MTRTRTAGLALLLSGLLLAGCGGGGEGEPTVTQTVHDELQAELQAELDAALAELAAEREAKAEERAARATAETEARLLRASLGAETDAADPDGSLYAQLNHANANVTELTAQLETAQESVTHLTTQLETTAANVQSLTAEIGSVNDPASLHGRLAAEQAEVRRLEALIGDATDRASTTGSLYAQLNAEKAEVARLIAAIGAATDAASASATASLHAQLNAAKAEVMRLEDVIGMATDTADDSTTASLHAQLNAEKAEVMRLLEDIIGSATDTADDSPSASLHAQLNAAKAEVTALETQIGMATDTANDSATASLHAQLNAAKARVMELATLIGDPVTPSATSLRGLLAAANAKADRLEAQIGTGTTGLQGQLAEAQAEIRQLKADLEDEKDEVARLTTELATARSNAASAQQQAQQAQQQAQDQVSNLEANQRAQRLKDAISSATPESALSNIGLEITVPTQSSLRIARGGHQAGTISGISSRSGSWIRSRELPLISGADDGKTVVYTDRELRRPLLEHFDRSRDYTAGGDVNRFLVAATANGVDNPVAFDTAGEIPHVSTPRVSTKWRISHGLSTNPTAEQVTHLTDSTDADYDPPDPRNSYTGYLYGLSGSFICDGAVNCQVQLSVDDASYAAVDSNDRRALLSVDIAATSGGTLYFKPSSGAIIPLYTGGPVGPDAEYMAFGYWRENPTSAAADYKVGVFAQAFGRSAGSIAGVTATYDGTAVGMYVEQDPNDPVDTHRQGEFTADVNLRAVNGVVNGDIDDFVTTPTGGSAQPRTADRWVVNLCADVAAAGCEGPGIDASATAVIATLSGVKTGTWTPAYVVPHANAAAADGQSADATPRAATGTFRTSIENFVELLGAFGAEKR